MEYSSGSLLDLTAHLGVSSKSLINSLIRSGTELAVKRVRPRQASKPKNFVRKGIMGLPRKVGGSCTIYNSNLLFLSALSTQRSALENRAHYFQDKLKPLRRSETTLLPRHLPFKLSMESPMKTTNPSSEHELQLERQAVRKLDYTILPIMTIFYLLSFLVCFV